MMGALRLLGRIWAYRNGKVLLSIAAIILAAFAFSAKAATTDSDGTYSARIPSLGK